MNTLIHGFFIVVVLAQSAYTLRITGPYHKRMYIETQGTGATSGSLGILGGLLDAKWDVGAAWDLGITVHQSPDGGRENLNNLISKIAPSDPYCALNDQYEEIQLLSMHEAVNTPGLVFCKRGYCDGSRDFHMEDNAVKCDFLAAFV